MIYQALLRSGAAHLIALVLILCACTRDVTVTEPEARELASKALARYCEQEKLSSQYFKVSEVTPNAGAAQWLIVYASTGIRPNHEVAVIIGKDGGLEVSRMIEGQDD